MVRYALLCVIIVAVCGFPLTAGAGQNANAYMTFDLYKTFPGIAGDRGKNEIGEIGPNEKIYMKIYVHNVRNLKGWEFRFSYNDALVQPVAVNGDSLFLPDIPTEKNILKKNYDFNIYIIPGQSTDPRIIYGGTLSATTDTAFAADGSGLIGVMAFKTAATFTGASSAEFSFYRQLFLSIQDPDTGGDLFTENLNKGYIRGGIVAGIDDAGSIPSSFELLQNYPNPFNPSTRIPFQLSRSTQVSLLVYNSLGQEVALIINTRLAEGWHEYEFRPMGLPSGIYFYVLKTEEGAESRKMILIK